MREDIKIKIKQYNYSIFFREEVERAFQELKKEFSYTSDKEFILCLIGMGMAYLKNRVPFSSKDKNLFK